MPNKYAHFSRQKEAQHHLHQRLRQAPTHQRMACTRKRGYDTQHHAMEHARVKGYGEVGAYQCDHCTYWHLYSIEKLRQKKGW